MYCRQSSPHSIKKHTIFSSCCQSRRALASPNTISHWGSFNSASRKPVSVSCGAAFISDTKYSVSSVAYSPGANHFFLMRSISWRTKGTSFLSIYLHLLAAYLYSCLRPGALAVVSLAWYIRGEELRIRPLWDAPRLRAGRIPPARYL